MMLYKTKFFLSLIEKMLTAFLISDFLIRNLAFVLEVQMFSVGHPLILALFFTENCSYHIQEILVAKILGHLAQFVWHKSTAFYLKYLCLSSFSFWHLFKVKLIIKLTLTRCALWFFILSLIINVLKFIDFK